MSETVDANPRKLPPLARNGDVSGSEPQSSVRKKKKRRETVEESPREGRPRSNSRSRGRNLPSSRTESDADIDPDPGEAGVSRHSRPAPSLRQTQDSLVGLNDEEVPVSPVERKIRKKKQRPNTDLNKVKRPKLCETKSR